MTSDFDKAAQRADKAIEAAEAGRLPRGELRQEGARAYVGHAVERTPEELERLELDQHLAWQLEELAQAAYNIDDEMLARMGPAERRLVEGTRALLAAYDADRKPASPHLA